MRLPGSFSWICLCLVVLGSKVGYCFQKKAGSEYLFLKIYLKMENSSYITNIYNF